MAGFVIIVRHAHDQPCNGKSRISDRGRQQVEELVRHLREWITSDNVRVLSSSALRAVDTATDIMKPLQIPADRLISNELLWREEYPPPFAETAQFIDSHDDSEVLLIISHTPAIPDILRHFANVGGDAALESSLSNCDALVIDTKWRRQQRINPGG